MRTSPAKRSPASLASSSRSPTCRRSTPTFRPRRRSSRPRRQRLQAKVEAFRTKKETLKATYTAAEAQTNINEAFSGISEEMSDVGMAVERAEDKTAQMQARASAVDELIASGALTDPISDGKDDISAELDRAAASGDVELEMAKLKAQLGAGPDAPAQIEGATTDSAEKEGQK